MCSSLIWLQTIREAYAFFIFASLESVRDMKKYWPMFAEKLSDSMAFTIASIIENASKFKLSLGGYTQN